MLWGKSRIVFGLTGVTFLYLLLFPIPSEMAGFWISCTGGNFQPSNTCQRMCRMLGNLTSCCYGVNYAGRSACGCCANVTNCPANCESNCVMVSLNTDNCAGSNMLGDVPKTYTLEAIPLFPGPELIPIIPVPLSNLILTAPLPE